MNYESCFTADHPYLGRFFYPRSSPVMYNSRPGCPSSLVLVRPSIQDGGAWYWSIGNILSCFLSEDVASMEGASGMVSMLSRGNLNQNVLCISCFPKRCRIFIQLCSRDEKQLSSYSYRDHHPSPLVYLFTLTLRNCSSW